MTARNRLLGAQLSRVNLLLWMLLILVLWLQCALAANVIFYDHDCATQEQREVPTCEIGGYIINPNSKLCMDRYYCYKNVKEPCDDKERRCHPQLSCRCGRCQNCLGTNCFLEFCVERKFLKRWPKRFENNVLD